MMETDRQHKRNRLVAASLRLALTNTATRVSRPHVNSVFDIKSRQHNGSSDLLQPGDQQTSRNAISSWKWYMRRYFSSASVQSDERLESRPTTSNDSMPSHHSDSTPHVMRRQSMIEDTALDGTLPANLTLNETVMSEPSKSRQTPQLRVDSAHSTMADGDLSSRSQSLTREERGIRSPSPAARAPFSDSTTLVSLDMTSAVAQVIQPSQSSFASPTTDSSFPSFASPCVRITSSFLQGHDSPASPHVVENPQQNIPDAIGTVIRRPRYSRRSSLTIRTNTAGSHSRLRPTSSRSTSAIIQTESEDNLERWLARIAMTGTIDSSPPTIFSGKTTPVLVSSPPIEPEQKSPSTTHGTVPPSPSSYTQETYPRIRVMPGRVVYKAHKSPSTGCQTRPKPGEFLTKSRPHTSQSTESSFCRMSPVNPEDLQANTNGHSQKSPLASFISEEEEPDWEPTHQQDSIVENDVSQLEFDLRSDDQDDLVRPIMAHTEDEQFSTSLAQLKVIFGTADTQTRSKLKEQIDSLLNSVGQSKISEPEHSQTKSRSRGRSKQRRLKKQSSGVSIVQGKHGDENYFGQAVLSPAFI